MSVRFGLSLRLSHSRFVSPLSALMSLIELSRKSKSRLVSPPRALMSLIELEPRASAFRLVSPEQLAQMQ